MCIQTHTTLKFKFSKNNIVHLFIKQYERPSFTHMKYYGKMIPMIDITCLLAGVLRMQQCIIHLSHFGHLL